MNNAYYLEPILYRHTKYQYILLCVYNNDMQFSQDFANHNDQLMNTWQLQLQDMDDEDNYFMNKKNLNKQIIIDLKALIEKLKTCM